MSDTPGDSSPTAGSKAAASAAEASSPDPGPEAVQFASTPPPVRLPPMPSGMPSVAVSQPRSILKVTSTAQPPPHQPETQPVASATETSVRAEQAAETSESPKPSPDSAAVLQRHHRHWHTEAALILAAVLAVLVVSVSFVMALQDRAQLYQLAGLVHASRLEVMPPDWLELAVCFGPRLPAGALQDSTTGSAPPNVDDTSTYRQLLGGGGFDWSRSPFKLLATPAAAGARHLGRLRVTTSEKKQPELHYTDLPLLLHYSLCRNYSGFRWSPARGEGEHWLDLTMSMEEHDLLLDGVTSSFVDVFAYQRGTFSEFFTNSRLVPFRTDMGRPLRLRLEAELHRHVPHTHEPCAPRVAGEESISCLPWCLTRALLRRAACTMPWMDAMVFNMTALRMTLSAIPTHRDPKLFSAKLALPWMAEFATLPPCTSAEEFNKLFRLVDALLLYERTAPDPEVLRCRAACPPPCDQLETRLRLAGGALAPHRGISLLRIEVPHSLRVLHRRVLFEAPALLLEMAGLLAFLFGASLLGLHDWCFAAVYHLLSRAGLLEKAGGDGTDADDGGSSDGEDGDESDIDEYDVFDAGDQEQSGKTAEERLTDGESGGLGDYSADSGGSIQ